MVSSVGGAGGQVGLGAVSDARSFSAGYVVGGLFTGLALPALLLLRRLGGHADLVRSEADSGTDASCPTGLPRETGIEAVPVPALTDG